MGIMREQYILKEDLLSVLGPAPNIEATAKFLREDPQLIYRKLYRGELQRLPGLGVIKISIPSILKYLNGGSVHVKKAPQNKTGRTGRKPKAVQENMEAR